MWSDVDTDDAMDVDKDSRMARWFALIKRRNELIREESDLMYRFVHLYFILCYVLGGLVM